MLFHVNDSFQSELKHLTKQFYNVEFLSLVCWDQGKDGIRSSDRVCGEESSPRNRHKGEEPLQLPLSGSPPWLQAVASGNHGGGAPSPGGHQLQRVRWLPDRTAQQGRFRTKGTLLRNTKYFMCLGKLEECLVCFSYKTCWCIHRMLNLKLIEMPMTSQDGTFWISSPECAPICCGRHRNWSEGKTKVWNLGLVSHALN